MGRRVTSTAGAGMLVSIARRGPSRDVDGTTPLRGGGAPRSPLAHERQRSRTLGRGPAPAAHQLQGTSRCSPQSVGLELGPTRTSCLAVLRQHHSRPAPSQGDKLIATPDGGITPSLAFAHQHAGRPRACVHPLWRQPRRLPLSPQPERRVDVSIGHACNFATSVIPCLHPRPLRHSSHGHGPHVLQLTGRGAIHCQRQHVRFVAQPARLPQPSLAPISSCAAQDHRGRGHRRAHYPPLDQPIVVALGSALARPVGLPAAAQVLRPAVLCSRHKVDPFAHGTTRLIALAFNGKRGWKRGTRA